MCRGKVLNILCASRRCVPPESLAWADAVPPLGSGYAGGAGKIRLYDWAACSLTLCFPRAGFNPA